MGDAAGKTDHSESRQTWTSSLGVYKHGASDSEPLSGQISLRTSIDPSPTECNHILLHEILGAARGSQLTFTGGTWVVRTDVARKQLQGVLLTSYSLLAHCGRMSHLRVYRVHDGIVQEFHHHKLLEGHQVLLVGLIDTLEEEWAVL